MFQSQLTVEEIAAKIASALEAKGLITNDIALNIITNHTIREVLFNCQIKPHSIS